LRQVDQRVESAPFVERKMNAETQLIVGKRSVSGKAPINC